MYPTEFSTRRKLYCPSVSLSQWFQQTIPQSDLIDCFFKGVKSEVWLLNEALTICIANG